MLDGFDEFCVLTQNNNLIGFILDKLTGFSTSDFKILITSRKSEQYFSDYSIERSGNIRTINLKWYSSSVEKWCKKYEKLAHSEEIKDWCRTFPEKLRKEVEIILTEVMIEVVRNIQNFNCKMQMIEVKSAH